jgi:CubicO group peptidase (beta-lactamase class C family)
MTSSRPRTGTAARLIVIIGIALTAVSVACRPSPDASAPARIDALFAEWNRPDSPGCGVGVSRDGAIVFERGYGMANVERRIPITPATVFDVASISKPFTAMSIMLLADQGRLRLDDEVWTHVPEWVNRADRITIRHLLAHTAGLRDVFLLTELGPPPPADTNINEHLQGILARQRGVNFPPGREFSYNNGGYNLLAGIVGRVSGVPFPAFVEAQIFTPLGMTQSMFRGQPGVVHPDQAVGYHQDEQGVRIAREGGADTSAIVGNSGLSTTVGDLLRWMQNFAEPRVGDRARLAEMETPVALPGGGTSPYGLGLEVGTDRGLETVGHGGGDRGIATYVIRYPERGVAAAVLCNLDSVGSAVGALARQVAAVYLPALAEEPGGTAQTPPLVALTPDELESKAGLYRDPATDTFGRVYVRDGRLMASADAGDGPGDSVELTPIDRNRFIVPYTPIVAEFVLEAGDRPQEVRVTGMGPTPAISHRVDTGFTPTPSELRAFGGRYANGDLDVVYTVVAGESGLLLRIPGRADSPLQPILPDGFYGSLVDLIRFSRGERRTVTGFTVNRSTVRNLRFERVQ